MGSVLQFRIPDRIDRPGHRPLGIGDGELVIFPGVRVERPDDEAGLQPGEPPREAGFDGLDGNWPRQRS